MPDFDIALRWKERHEVLVTAATKYGQPARSLRPSERSPPTAAGTPWWSHPKQIQAVDGFDAVVLGSAVYAGHWLKPARELVDRSRDALAARPVWLFSSGPIGDPPQAARTRSTWPRSWRPPRPVGIVCSTASW